jgi:hypothetical protein
MQRWPITRPCNGINPVTESVVLPPEQGEHHMIDQPHFDSYSIPARICLGIGGFGGALLAIVLTIIYLL